jgi:TPR repeat protein
VEQDLNKAMELYEEAASYENQDAIDALARLSK